MAKKTRILFALLLVLMMVFTAACSGKDSDSDKDDKKSDKGGSSLSDVFGKGDQDEETDPTEPDMVITTQPIVNEGTEPTEPEETEPAETEPAETEPTEPAETEPTEIEVLNPADIIGTVLYDHDGVKVTVTAFEDKSYYGPEISVIIDNTTDKSVLVSSEQLSVNGYMMDDVMLYAEVEPGTQVEDYLMFSDEDMAQCGITELANVEFYIQVMDPETYKTLDTSKLLSLKLIGNYDQAIDYSGTELYNQDGVRIIYKGIEGGSMFDGLVYLFVENNSGRDISVYAREITINGMASDDSFWSDLRAGTVVIDSMVMWDLEAVNVADVSQIETISMQFRIIDLESWDELAVTDTITINIEK